VKAPKFWEYGSGSPLQYLLKPVSFAYSMIDRINRSRITSQKVDVPILCVGNVVAGGAGKTPVALTLAKYLQSRGWTVHFLSRGYGGTENGPTAVTLDVHSAAEVGDEPLLLAEQAPTWVSRDRIAGAQAAITAGAELIIMDDGFQNPTLEKDINILVIDGGYGVGNGQLIPAGPLRETLGAALSRATAVVLVEPTNIVEKLSFENLPVFQAKVIPKDLLSELVGEKVVAFAGIGRPEKFFKSLEDTGADVVECIEFADHHAYSQDDIMRLVEIASERDAALVTTKKDYVRLSPEARLMTTVFDIDLVFDKPQQLQALLNSKLGRREHV
jgi:tetraacyldisaccharide 4'-kinase